MMCTIEYAHLIVSIQHRKEHRMGGYSVIIGSRPFRDGFGRGMTGADRRFDLVPPITEDRVVSVVQNLCDLAAAGELTEQRMLYDCGLLCAWIISAWDAMNRR
jgi:hypothetical protein